MAWPQETMYTLRGQRSFTPGHITCICSVKEIVFWLEDLQSSKNYQLK